VCVSLSLATCGLLVALAQARALSNPARDDKAHAEPSLRILVVDERGAPIDLSETPNLGVADDQGNLTYAPVSHERPGVAEARHLEPGTYWVFVQVAHREREVRVIALGAGDPLREERVALRRSQNERPDWLGMEGGRDNKRTWSASGAVGRVKLLFRLESPTGLELPAEFRVGSRCGALDALGGENLPAGAFELTFVSRDPGRILFRSPGYAPGGVSVDLSESRELDLGAIVLQPAIPVRARLIAPRGVTVKRVAWKYAPRADLEVSERSWELGGDGAEAVLELGAGPYVVSATIGDGQRYWETPYRVFDASVEADELELPLVEVVPLVLEPTALHEALQLEVLDASGFLVERREANVDVPFRLGFIPGTYTLRHRLAGSAGEFHTQTVVVGSSLTRLALEL